MKTRKILPISLITIVAVTFFAVVLYAATTKEPCADSLDQCPGCAKKGTALGIDMLTSLK